MDRKAKAKQKCCGNCGNHVIYEYPDKIFCSIRFCNNENPIMGIFEYCEDWNPNSQECFCLEEAARKKNEK